MLKIIGQLRGWNILVPKSKSCGPVRNIMHIISLPRDDRMRCDRRAAFKWGKRGSSRFEILLVVD
jgi:hypothetical protein